MNLQQVIAELIKREKVKLDEFSLKHPGLIGDMYEGLTKDIVSKIILPSRIDLRVVDGVVQGKGKLQSHQIDCMIVEGEGTPIPRTNHFVYPADQVIAIVETKKNLFSGELIDSMQKLENYYLSIEGTYDIRKFHQDVWESLTDEPMPDAGVKGLTGPRQILYAALKTDLNMPLRIVLGYNGFSSEESLRKGFIDCMKNVSNLSFNMIPDLTLCRGFSIVKLNGQPYCGPFDRRDNKWLFIGSKGRHSDDLIASILTRISYLYDLPELTDNLPDMEYGFIPLLYATPSAEGWGLEFEQRQRKDFEKTSKRE